MSGMGLLGAALAGAAGGVGRGISENAQRQMADESAMKREQSSMALREQYAIEAEKRAEERAKQKRIDLSGNLQGFVERARVDLSADGKTPSEYDVMTRARQMADMGGYGDEAGIIGRNAGQSEYDKAMAQAKLDKAELDAQGKDKALKPVENGRGGIDWFDERGNLVKSTKGGKTRAAGSGDGEGGKSTAGQRDAAAAAEKLKRLRLKDPNGQIRPLGREEYAELASWTDRAENDKFALEEAPKWVKNTINQNGGVSAMWSLFKESAIAGSYLQERPTNTPKPAAPKQSAPKGGLPDGIPPGSKQIGTSGGKPVFQAPNGKRYIVD